MIFHIIKDFWSTFRAKVLVFLLMIMLIDYAGYGYYIFYISLAYILFYRGFKTDRNFFILFIWGVIYSVTIYFNTRSISYVNNILPVINMPFLYLMGRYICIRNSNEKITYIIYFFCLSIAVVSILSIFKDITDKGFLVIGMERNVPLIGIENEEGWVAATGIASRLLMLVGFISVLFCPLKLYDKLLFTVPAIIAFVCTLRIQSRTCIVFFILAIILAIFFMWRNFDRKYKFFFILIFLLFSIIVFLVLQYYSSELLVFERFQAEDFETGGGRTTRLFLVASKMIEYPLGNMPNYISYAHNLWFDCARVAGIIPFTILLYLMYKYTKNVFIICKNKNIPLLCKLSMVLTFLALLTVFSSEPVLEGIPMVFGLYCLLFGISSVLRTQRGI